MTRSQEYHKNKRDEILSKFSSAFEEKCYKRNPTYDHTLGALARGADVYMVLEQVLDNLDTVYERYTDLIQKGPPPVMIGTVSDEIAREMLNRKI